jgi:hypothetical protein
VQSRVAVESELGGATTLKKRKYSPYVMHSLTISSKSIRKGRNEERSNMLWDVKSETLGECVDFLS